MPYLLTPANDLGRATRVELDLDLVLLIKPLIHWIIAISIHLKDLFVPFSRDIWHWLVEVIKSIGKLSLDDIFERPSRWPVQAVHAGYTFLAHHLHIVHIIALSIFFGPIIVLLPFLLIHELVISLLFNLSFLMHGLVPGTADTHYSYLRKTLLSAKESVFASVDSAGSIYNKWTIDFAPLAVLRVVALGLGCYALYEIWGIE